MSRSSSHHHYTDDHHAHTPKSTQHQVHSGSDSDDDHENEHHHDAHSSIHHHHQEYVSESGVKQKVNVFDKDLPNGGHVHFHNVRMRNKAGQWETIPFIHEGDEHVDVPSSHPQADIFNNKKYPITFPVKPAAIYRPRPADDSSEQEGYVRPPATVPGAVANAPGGPRLFGGGAGSGRSYLQPFIDPEERARSEAEHQADTSSGRKICCFRC